MKKLFLSATAIAIAMSASAFAADLPSIKSAPATPTPLWTGFYAGLNAGYGFGTNNNAYASSWGPEGFNTDSYPPSTKPTMPLLGVGLTQSGIVSNNQNGFIGGFQAGYNYQFKDKFVVGLEADIQGTNIRGSGNRSGAAVNTNSLNDGTATTIGGVQVSSGVDWLGTVRGRLGYLWNPSLMLFGTAGLTYGGVHANVTNQAFTAYEDIPVRGAAEGTHPFFGTSSQSQTLVGWNAGGGFEWMLSQNWSVKGEAFYWNLGNMNVATTSVAPLIASALWGGTGTPEYSIPAQAGTGTTAINYQGVVARAGLNYHFNSLTNSFPTSVWNADDILSLKSTPATPPLVWTGLFAGLNAGYGFGTNNNAYAASWGPQGFTTDSDGSSVTTMPLYGVGLSQSGIVSNNQNGFIGGFQAGYNYQFKDKFVVGLEADIQGTNISGTGNRSGAAVNTNSAKDGTATTIGGVQVSSGVDWLGTVRGRMGYLWNPSLMLFGTAGLTYGGVHANVTNLAFTAYEDIPVRGAAEGTHPFFGTSSQSQTLVGWNAGGGFEWMLSQNWSVKGEAFYWNLGNMNVATTSVAPLIASAYWGDTRTPEYSIPAQAGAGNTNINYQGVIARAGVNYHFDLGRAVPVIAKF